MLKKMLFIVAKKECNVPKTERQYNDGDHDESLYKP